jgi:hypothetical protein
MAMLLLMYDFAVATYIAAAAIQKESMKPGRTAMDASGTKKSANII